MNHYNSFQKILHNLILGNKFIGLSLFEIEKILYSRKEKRSQDNQHVFITSLPRSGTTTLLNLIFSSGQFGSLKYSNMPFLPSPNLSKLFSQKKIETKERLHGDGITFDLDSPEAFDEFFFINLSSEKKQNYNDFKEYIDLILHSQVKERYLSKNNSNYKRIIFLQSLLPKSIFLIPIRKPLQHANSLLKQHINFSEIQQKDNFVKKYMGYLGHHEFGLNHKYWNKPIEYKDPNQLNYWIEQWYLFYDKIYENFKDNKNCFFLLYENFSNKDYMREFLKSFSIENVDFNIIKNSQNKKIDSNFNQENLVKAEVVYNKFLEIKS